MPIINKGTSFSNGEQLTAKKINDMLDLATFNQSATDSTSTTVNSASQIIVRDSGVTTAKLATDAVETAKIKDANVTKAKIEDVADYKVLGNVSGSAAAPAEVAILDEDDMATNSATALATQQSIKAYVDTPIVIGPTNLTLLNGAVPYSATYETPSYYKTKGNFVTLRGLLKSATGNPIATLPVGCRPAKQLLFSVSADYPNVTYGTGRLDVKANGDLVYASNNNDYNSLDGVTFLADGT